MKIDIRDFIPQTTDKGYDISIHNDGVFVIASYECKFSKPERLRIRRYIELDDLFFEGFGLINGDGDRYHFVGLSNSELSVLQHFMDFMEKTFWIPRDVFTARLILPEGFDPVETKRTFASGLCMREDQITGTGYKEDHRRPVLNVYKRTKMIDLIFRGLYEFSQHQAEQRKEFAIPYLRGVIASEGCVQRRNTTRSVFAVKISSLDPENTRLYKNLLELCGIGFGKDERDCIPIRHMSNFQKLEEFDMLKLSNAKKLKFSSGMLLLKENKANMLDRGITNDRIMGLLDDIGPMTVPAITAELRKIRPTQDRSTVYKHIWELEKSGKVKRTGFKMLRKPYHKIIIWSINPAK